jgi:hypothetical protein
VRYGRKRGNGENLNVNVNLNLNLNLNLKGFHREGREGGAKGREDTVIQFSFRLSFASFAMKAFDVRPSSPPASTPLS